MIAIQRRSGKRHLIHPDGLATRCGRILRRTSFLVVEGRVGDCERCYALLAADIFPRERAKAAA